MNTSSKIMSSKSTLTFPQTTLVNNIFPEVKNYLDQAVAWILNPQPVDAETIKEPGPTQACHKQ